MVIVAKNPLANAGDTREEGSIPGWGRSPGEGNGTPLQYSCLENSMNRGAWQATVHGADEGHKTAPHPFPRELTSFQIEGGEVQT